MLRFSVLLFFLTALTLASPSRRSFPKYDPRPYSSLARRAVTNGTENELVVDLGYSIYRGVHNSSSQINSYRGIRFGQDTSTYRWQLPRAPLTNRSAIIDASDYAATCPQAPDAATNPVEYDNSDTSEDCLFLNVQAPSKSNNTSPTGLPVLVWIHGGGYGAGGNGFDFTPIIGTNHNQFIVVSIQYRLGAFGFLSSDEVHRFGTPNAGIFDQQLALQWVQQYIHLFGGDSTRVTIFGESAGAGSVMLHDIAYGGTLGTTLFRNSITSSPYLPFQYGYADWQPSQAYYAFATAVGCNTHDAYLHNGGLRNNQSTQIFKCLSQADSATLIEANSNVSQSGTWGTWAFLPVTDGRLIQDRPSKQLGENRVNGVNHLAGHNAMEGAAWIPPVINTIDELVDYLATIFPMFDNNDIAKILYYYPSSNATDNPNAPLFATLGDSGPTTINQSIAATGQMERAIAVYGETTFICPSYWLAEAYSDNAWGGQGYKYQFSIPNAYHGADGAAFLQPPYTTSYYSTDFVYAFQTMYGNFIVNDDPSVPSRIANGVTRDNTTFNPLSEFPPYSIYEPALMDMNTTCPEIIHVGGLPYCTGGDQRNAIRLADAYTWEGGRGVRCDFWKSMGELVPE